jgi:uncharacterized protein (TIGR00369 family)
MAIGMTDPGVPEGFTPIVHHANFGALTGPFYDKESADGFVRAFRVQEKHINPGGIAHGGMLATFADIVLARAILREQMRPMVTIRLLTDFTGPARLGDWVEGRAEVVRSTRSLVFARGELMVGHHRVLIASGVFRVLPRPQPRSEGAG